MRWSIGERRADGRWFAPSAERNKEPILEVLRRVLPAGGLVLEIGSGTGQHIVYFARALPALGWQPTEPDPDLRHSTALWIEAEAPLPNVRPPLALDVLEAAWPITAADALVCINVVHVTPWEATQALLRGAARLLPADAPMLLYGPYRRADRPTAPGNERFDADLRAHDPRWGLRRVEDLADAAARAGLALSEIVDMPANNLSLILRRA